MMMRCWGVAFAAGVCGALAMASLPGTSAAWTDSATVSSTIQALDLAEPVLSCDVVNGDVVISWPRGTVPTVLAYVAKVNGNETTPTLSNGTYSVTLTSGLVSDLLGTLLSDTAVTVTVYAVLPSSDWVSQTVSRNAQIRLLLPDRCL